ACFQTPSRYRVQWPPLSPADVLAQQSHPAWRQPAHDAVMEFCFSSSSEGDKSLWEWYLQLAAAGLFVHEVCQGTPWADRVNAWGGHGTKYVPAVRTTVGVTLNWWKTGASGDGRIRLDGKDPAVEAMQPRMRRAFEEYIQGRTMQGKLTGNQANRAKVQQGRLSQEDVRRRGRMARTAGKALALKGAALFRSGATEPGVWDLLGDHIGARSAPPFRSMPWPIVLRAGVVVSVHSDGRVLCVAGKATVDAVEEVEALLQRRLGAQWTEEDGYLSAGPAMEIVCGTPGSRALGLQQRAAARARAALAVEIWMEGVRPYKEALRAAALVPAPGGSASLRGAPRRLWAAGTSADVAALLQEASEAVEGQQRAVHAIPGVLAAREALAAELRRVRSQASRGASRRSRLARLGLQAAAYAGPMGKAQEERCAGAGGQSRLWSLAGVSAGYSGGANPQGTGLLLERWRDVGSFMGALCVDFFLSAACRLLPGSDLKSVLLEFAYDPLGPRSSAYDVVCGFCQRDSLVPVEWRSEWSDTPRVQWFVVDSTILVGGFVIPPRGPRASESVRMELLERMFSQYDAIRQGHCHLREAVVYGDLNPSKAAPDGARCFFERDPDGWRVAQEALGDFMGLAAEEVERWTTHRATWQPAPVSRMQCAAEIASWLWRASMYLAAACGQLMRTSTPKRTTPRQSAKTELVAQEVQAGRRATAAIAAADAQRRADRYIGLVMDDPGEAGKYLSRLTAKRGIGLPSAMEDYAEPGKFLHGASVLEGAAAYIASRGRGRENLLTHVQRGRLREVEQRCSDVLGRQRDQWRSRWCEDHRPYTTDDLEAACGKVKIGKASAGLPYASIKTTTHVCARLQLAVQNLSRFLMVVPQCWKCQPTFHSHSRGRPVHQYSSYRTLSANTLELRIAEEMWAAACEERLWTAAGEEQLGRGDSLVAAVMGLDVRRMRCEQGLPLGELFTDLAEAFDTAHDLVAAAGMLEGSVIKVVSPHAQARPVELGGGVPEGRRPAPALFACSARRFGRVLEEEGFLGVGLDPPEEAVFSLALQPAPEAEEAAPDVAWCIAEARACGEDDGRWRTAMAAARTRDEQLTLLDAASTVRLGITQFMDDNCVRASCRGALKEALTRTLDAVARLRGQLRFGLGKTECIAQGFADTRAIERVVFVPCHVALGLPMDPAGRLTELLQQEEGRAIAAWGSALLGIELVGLPLRAALAALGGRVLPRACHGASLLVVRKDWDTRLDAVYDRWVVRFLELVKPVPRVALLREIGFPWRLSTRVLRDALALLAWVEALAAASSPRRVAGVAAGFATTWAATVKQHAVALGIQDLRGWAAARAAGQPETLTRQARKRLIRRYIRLEVAPPLQRREEAWRAQQLAVHPPRGAATVAEAAESQFLCKTVRPWAQLRLQGHFSTHMGGEGAACSWCGAEVEEAVAGTLWEGLPAEELHQRCREDDDVLTAVAVTCWLQALAQRSHGGPRQM
ncbi:unnamed protein product, partial [Prorocentrum cordatum]